ncbi:hypothetical protein FRC04_006634 [Tulasnella sp. 424]|nr:hypothetical protein FRC04_006634 [Tulasnella sp. 424]KAG8960754.1 hypothetical protein FRC05_006580 [Tulasnella sp. 425]
MAHSDNSLRSVTPPSHRIRDASRGTAFDGLDEDLSEVENSRSALRQVMRNLQTELAEKNQVIEEQQDTIQQLQSDVQGLKKTAIKRRKRATAVPVNESEQLLELAAKKFTVMNHFYIADPNAFLKVPLSQTWTDRSRFDSQQNQDEGSVRELDELLSDDLKEQRIRSADCWAAVFEQAQQDERHSMTHRIRTSNTTAVFGSEIAAELEARHRSRSTLLQQRLGFNTESGSYERVPPILRANPDEPASKSNMLNSLVVKRVIQAMLMGPASLGKNQDPDVSLSAKCNGKIWSVTSVTPGIIAFAAILIRYALSPDNEFGPTGQTSGISYLEDFEYYKKCLLVGQRKKVRQVLDLFDNLNGALFPHHKASWRDRRDNQSSSAAEDDELFREIAEAVSEEEGEEEDCRMERTNVLSPAVRAESSLSTDQMPSDMLVDGSDKMTTEPLSRNGEEETEKQVEGGGDVARGGDRPKRGGTTGKRGAPKPKRGTGKKKGI